MEFCGRIGLHRVLLCCLWGRKDGFPGADGSTIQISTGGTATTIPLYGSNGNLLAEGSTGIRLVNITAVIQENSNTLAYATKNPLAFIYNMTTPYDWYTNTSNNQNDQLWTPQTKSSYDPCPVGWQVGANNTNGDFSLLITARYYIQGAPTSYGNFHYTNGILYQNMVWCPASGWRRNTTGILQDIGGTGLYWSSTSSNTDNAYYTNANKEGIYPNSSSSRANGFSVRCIQE